MVDFIRSPFLALGLDYAVDGLRPAAWAIGTPNRLSMQDVGEPGIQDATAACSSCDLTRGTAVWCRQRTLPSFAFRVVFDPQDGLRKLES